MRGKGTVSSSAEPCLRIPGLGAVHSVLHAWCCGALLLQATGQCDTDDYDHVVMYVEGCGCPVAWLRREVKKLPFFIYAYIDENIIVARCGVVL